MSSANYIVVLVYHSFVHHTEVTDNPASKSRNLGVPINLCARHNGESPEN